MLPETTVHSSVRQSCLCRIVPRCISSANARLGPAGSRFKACPPETDPAARTYRTRRPSLQDAVSSGCQVEQLHLFCAARDLREGDSQCLRSIDPADSWSWIFAKTGSHAG